MTTNINMILVLILLRLLQIKQKILITKFLIKKAIILDGGDGWGGIWLKFMESDYTYIFKSLEIAFSKKFTKNILNNY